MFTKLFSSIIYSSVWQEPDGTRLVWITLLALSDRKGFVYGSVPGLASAARVDVKECREALERFCAPDPESSNPDNEGRRIEAVPGGWHLLNYERYRGLRDEESRREYKSAWQRERRKAAKEAPAREKAVQKLMRPGGARTMEERLREKAEKEGDNKTIAALDRMSPHQRQVKATSDDFVAKFHKSMEAANAALAAASPEAAPIDPSALTAEGAEGQKFPEV